MTYLCSVIEAYKNKKLCFSKIILMTIISSIIINSFYNISLNQQLISIFIICFSFEIYKLVNIKMHPYAKFSIILSIIKILINCLKNDNLTDQILYINLVSTLSLFLLKNIYIK